jgi:hypothetical protein
MIITRNGSSIIPIIEQLQVRGMFDYCHHPAKKRSRDMMEKEEIEF